MRSQTVVNKNLRELGSNCAVQRRLLELTLADVAKRADVSINTVRSVEAGKPVRSDCLFAILNILQLLKPAVEGTNPYATALGLARANATLPKRVRH